MALLFVQLSVIVSLFTPLVMVEAARDRSNEECTFPRVSKIELTEAFGDVKPYPPLLMAHEQNSFSPAADSTERYSAGIQAVRHTIADDPVVSKENRDCADFWFLQNAFLSSDSSESRLVALGFKPVSFLGTSHRDTPKETILEMYGVTSVEDIHCDRPFRQNPSLFPDVGFTQIGLSAPTHDSYATFMYNRQAVASLVSLQKDAFDTLGFQPDKDADAFVDSVFSSKNSIAHSLLLGYPLVDSAVFYAKHPKALGPWSRVTSTDEFKQEQEYADVFWESLSALFNSKQLELLHRIAQQCASGTTILEGTGEYYSWWKNDGDKHFVDQIWAKIGMNAYLGGVRNMISPASSTAPKSALHTAF